jgi:hypothetical protein
MRAYYVLRALDSSMSELDRAMESATEIGFAEESLVVNAFQRIRHPLVRQAAASSVRDLANLDASLPRERTPYVLPGPLNPPASPALPSGEQLVDRPPVDQMGQDRIREVEGHGDARRSRRRRRAETGGDGEDANGTQSAKGEQ